MTKLYDIANEMLAILDNEELTPEMEDQLGKVQMEYSDKVEAVLQYHRGLVSHGEALVAEIKRLQAKRDAIESRAEWLKNYVQGTMQGLGLKKFYGLTFTATVQKSPAKVVIAEDAELPDAFVRVKTIREPDKEALLECSKLGYALPPGVEITTSTHLRIS